MKPGRNDPCPCGSGKKYKNCCYLTEQFTAIKNIIKPRGPVKQSPLSCIEDDYDDLLNQEFILNGINNLRGILMDKKQHIKEYHKARDMHGEIIEAMIKYYDAGKFKRRIDTDRPPETKPKNVRILETDFDMDTREGNQAFYEMWIYKTAPNVSCITDDFIRNHHYKKHEQIEFLHSMLDSKLGLFEITGVDMEEGYAYIEDVFTGAEYTIIDIGLSGQKNYDKFYLYTRIITYRNTSFGSGLNLIFNKDG